MSIHFISTTILSSEDGVDFNKEISVKESTRARSDTANAPQKPLAQIIAERKAKKEDEYESTGKAMRAPAPGLDDDDDLDYSRRNREEKSKEEEDCAVENFLRKRAATEVDVVESTNLGLESNAAVKTKASATSIDVITVVRKRRKVTAATCVDGLGLLNGYYSSDDD